MWVIDQSTGERVRLSHSGESLGEGASRPWVGVGVVSSTKERVVLGELSRWTGVGGSAFPMLGGAHQGSLGLSGQEERLERGPSPVQHRSPGGFGMGGGTPETGSRAGLGEAR